MRSDHALALHDHGRVEAPNLAAETVDAMPPAERTRRIEAELAGTLAGDVVLEYLGMNRLDHSFDDASALAMARRLDPQDPQAVIDRVRASVMADMPRLVPAILVLAQTLELHRRLDGIEVTVAIEAAMRGKILDRRPSQVDFLLGRRVRFERAALRAGDQADLLALWWAAHHETVAALAQGGR